MKKIICINVEFAKNNGTPIVTNMYENEEEVRNHYGELNQTEKRTLLAHEDDSSCVGFVDKDSEKDSGRFIQVYDDYDEFKIVED